jgi:hypothetical protein
MGALLVSTAALAGSGCGDDDALETGSARVALTQAPIGVRCLTITVQGTRTLTRSFDVTAGESTERDLNGLPTGVVSFTGHAFDTACSRVASSASPSWISDVVTVLIAPGGVANVDLLMRRNGKAGVDVDWATDAPQPIVYEPFGYASGEAALGENGGIGFSGEWNADSVTSLVHDNFVIDSGSLVYPGLAVSGGHVHSGAQTSTAGISRPLAQAIGQSGTTRYMSFLVQPEGVLGEGLFSGFFGVVLGSTQFNLFVGKPGGGALTSYVIEDLGGTGQVASTTAPTLGQVALLVIKGDFTDGLDRLTLYVNPLVGAPEPATGVVKQDRAFGEMGAFTLFSAGAFSLDEIRIGETFASVTPSAP